MLSDHVSCLMKQFGEVQARHGTVNPGGFTLPIAMRSTLVRPFKTDSRPSEPVVAECKLPHTVGRRPPVCWHESEGEPAAVARPY